MLIVYIGLNIVSGMMRLASVKILMVMIPIIIMVLFNLVRLMNQMV